MSPSTDLPAPTPALDAHARDPHFVERHQRAVHATVDDVWAAATSVTPAEVRLLAPFMALRSVPQLLAGGPRPSLRRGDTSLLQAFEAEGFVELERDLAPAEGRAVAVYGAAGRFWSPAASTPVQLADRAAFARHDGPGTAKVAFSLEVAEHDGAVLVTTETRITATDAAARRAFRLYWLVIRGPSGLIRRSWLAAIDRRARA